MIHRQFILIYWSWSDWFQSESWYWPNHHLSAALLQFCAANMNLNEARVNNDGPEATWPHLYPWLAAFSFLKKHLSTADLRDQWCLEFWLGAAGLSDQLLDRKRVRWSLCAEFLPLSHMISSKNTLILQKHRITDYFRISTWQQPGYK